MEEYLPRFLWLAPPHPNNKTTGFVLESTNSVLSGSCITNFVSCLDIAGISSCLRSFLSRASNFCKAAASLFFRSWMFLEDKHFDRKVEACLVKGTCCCKMNFPARLLFNSDLAGKLKSDILVLPLPVQE